MSDVTRLLDAMKNGEVRAAEDLLPLIYNELRRLASHKMAGESPDHTLQPTALVHEAWLRLVGGGREEFNNRAHFFNAAAEAMRCVLVDRARRKLAAKRGGGRERMNLEEAGAEAEIAAPDSDDRLLEINDALEKFAATHPKKAELVKLRYFAGMNNREAVAILGISEPTAKRWWAYSRAWLHEEIRKSREA